MNGIDIPVIDGQPQAQTTSLKGNKWDRIAGAFGRSRKGSVSAAVPDGGRYPPVKGGRDPSQDLGQVPVGIGLDKHNRAIDDPPEVDRGKRRVMGFKLGKGNEEVEGPVRIDVRERFKWDLERGKFGDRPELDTRRPIEEVIHTITSTMTCTEMVGILARHACLDLTPLLVESTCSHYPITGGGLSDVFSGTLFDRTPVAIKTIRTYCHQGQSDSLYNKRAAREVYTWSKCKHPNVAELIGVAVFRGRLAMISRWEENGSLLSYLSRHPSTDRCQLSAAICAGLEYLHGNDIVHGDLKGANILISQDGRPMLIDFGNASLMDATLQFTQTKTSPRFSIRWTAPGILEGTTLHSTASDIYSLGMTILETFTSDVPFAGRSEQSLLVHIAVHKKTPVRPVKAFPERNVYGDKLWAVLTECWYLNPEDRPSARAVLDSVTPITADKLEEMSEPLQKDEN